MPSSHILLALAGGKAGGEMPFPAQQESAQITCMPTILYYISGQIERFSVMSYVFQPISLPFEQVDFFGLVIAYPNDTQYFALALVEFA